MARWRERSVSRGWSFVDGRSPSACPLGSSWSRTSGDVMTTLRGVVHRTPFASPWVIAMIARYGLPFWFGIESALGIAVAAQDTKYWFFDARLYLDATRAWLAGGDPWAVQLAGNYFAAPPPTLLAFAPLTLF